VTVDVALGTAGEVPVGTAGEVPGGPVADPAGDRTVRVGRPARAAVVVGAVGAAGFAAWGSWALPAFAAFALVLAAIAVVDLEQLRVPNRILGPGFVAAIMLLAGATIATGDWGRLAAATLAAVACFTVFLGLRLARPSSLGMGDVKLAPYLALHLGWIAPGAVVMGFLIGAVSAAVAGALAMQVWRPGAWRSALPYAPFLALGALASAVLYTHAL
jgi:leader peptidase (prepilin peptidase)/N-methyltransferase